MEKKVTCMGSEKVNKNTWDNNNNNFSFDDTKDSYGYSWPPRHYVCSFCRRKFKSAQALGGHMNVHRRDRAMLRQPPSWVTLEYPNPNPNPNPKFSSSSSSSPSPSSTLPPPYNYNINSFLSPSLTSNLSSSPSSSVAFTNNEEKTMMVMGGSPRKLTSIHHDEITRRSSMKTLPVPSRVELKGFATREDGFNKVMNSHVVRLDLEIGLLKTQKKEDLDLELRLGYSS